MDTLDWAVVILCIVIICYLILFGIRPEFFISFLITFVIGAIYGWATKGKG